MSGPRPGFMPHNHYSGWSEETKKKISNSLTGQKQSEETKAKKKEAKKDLIWVHNKIDKPLQIKIFQFEEFQSKGYVRGRGPTSLW